MDTASSPYVRVLPAADLPSGAKKAVKIGEIAILICNADGQLHAVSNVCSHAQQDLEDGRMSYGWIACPAHGARFDLETGCPLNAPATKPIAVYPVRAVDDWIEVSPTAISLPPCT